MERYLNEEDRLPRIFAESLSRSGPLPILQSPYATSSYTTTVSPTATNVSYDDSIFTAGISPPTSTNSSSLSTDAGVFNGYNLPCEFGFIGCYHTFASHQVEDWIAHTFSHFRDIPFPPRARCIFCDNIEFRDTNLRRNWRTRMLHIRYHLENHDAPCRPDFGVIEHMKMNNMVSPEDYKHARNYTERPECRDLNLVPFNFETPEIEQARERDSRVHVDMGKEGRHWRRAAEKDKGKGPKKETSYKSRKPLVILER